MTKKQASCSLNGPCRALDQAWVVFLAYLAVVHPLPCVSWDLAIQVHWAWPRWRACALEPEVWLCYLVSVTEWPCVCLSHSVTSILCDPMDSSLPGSLICGILEARILEWKKKKRILEWVATVSFSRGSSQPRDLTRISCVSCIAGGYFTSEPPGKSSVTLGRLLYLPVRWFRLCEWKSSAFSTEALWGSGGTMRRKHVERCWACRQCWVLGSCGGSTAGACGVLWLHGIPVWSFKETPSRPHSSINPSVQFPLTSKSHPNKGVIALNFSVPWYFTCVFCTNAALWLMEHVCVCVESFQSNSCHSFHCFKTRV